MFCCNCGQNLPDGSKFCPNCGTPVESDPNPEGLTPEAEPVPAQAPETPAPEESGRTEELLPVPAEQGSGENAPAWEAEAAPRETPAPEGPKAKKKKLGPVHIALALVIAAAAICGGFFGFRWLSAQRAYHAELDDGAQALTDGNYAQALAHYQAALERKPGSAEAQKGLDEVVDGALGEAGDLLEDEDFKKAANLLKELALPAEDSRYERYAELMAVSAMDPKIREVDPGSFPTVVVTLSCGSEPAREDISVTEGGQTREIRDIEYKNGKLIVSYEAEDSGYETERRDMAVTVARGEFSFQRAESYDTPRFEPANVRLVSTDVSEYPVVRAYFRVEQSGGTAIKGLDKNSFLIRERLQGGEYLSREVRGVSLMESQGLNIDLVADKSDSISSSDMSKIKRVMIEFVNSLRYEVGDRAEVLAFDDIVQQMCYYTSDSTLLVNGINNMSTDGMTALYDAIHNGVRNASLQGGARCVIAFTDGMDNRSTHTASDVISYANTNQVPVYIIGVGNAVREYGELRRIAQSTGGRYWYIDDLYDLQEILNQVYSEQKELYMVEYVSDADGGQYDFRDLQVRVSGGGCKGEVETRFQPVRSVQGMNHSSRYELVKESTSWEEANRRCQEMGGHLATITSQEEMDQIIALAEANDARYIWLGGYTSYDEYGSVFGHWVTGEAFSFQAWSEREPSRVDKDGTPEWYIMLWNIPSLGGWCWNDQRNDPAAVVTGMQPRMCFVCEFES